MTMTQPTTTAIRDEHRAVIELDRLNHDAQAGVLHYALGAASRHPWYGQLAEIVDRAVSAGITAQEEAAPFPLHGVEIDDAGEFGDESVDVVVHRYVEIDTPENPRLTAAGARALAAALLAAADDLDRDDAR